MRNSKDLRQDYFSQSAALKYPTRCMHTEQEVLII